ncbi:MAG: NADH-ubiquinone oxidoreductase-F iron-sulfur binding region domain-containing protein, partial [bacterium]
IPLMELINDHCGGVKNGKEIKMVIPGGSSMPPLTREECLVAKMDNESLKTVGSLIGTAGVIVMDEDTDVVDVIRRITKFYYHESCGQCTPCREGCGWMLKVLNRIMEGNGRMSDLDLLVSVAQNIEGNTICALGEAAAWPVKFSVIKFRKDFEAKITNKTVELPVLNKVHGLRESDQYDTIIFQSEQEVVEDLIGSVQELTENEDVKKYSS